MNKKKKIVIVSILIIVFAACFIPNQDYNCKYRLNIVSSYGDDEAYHPKVLSFKEPWNGYKYWMSYTPYPQGDDAKENPEIAVSNDLITWIAPEGLNNPLDEPEETSAQLKYNSDSHIVYNNDLNRLECYWRYVDDVNDKVIVYRRTTQDGINWTARETTASSTSRKLKDYISPAIIYQNGIYKMWYVDKQNIVKFAISNDGVEWNDVSEVKLSYDNDKLLTWHLDVIYTEENSYEMLAVAYDEWANRNDMSLYYTKSKDGLKWDKMITIMKPSIRSQYWDNKGIYRSSILFNEGKYYVFYSGTDKSYHHGVGIVYGKDITNLQKVDTNFKNPKKVEILKEKINK